MVLILFLIIPMAFGTTGCLEDDVKGYVGNESGDGNSNIDPASSLIVVSPNVAEVTLVEGGTVNAIFTLNKSHSEDLTFNWIIETDTGDFITASGDVTVAEGEKELVVPIKSLSDSIYEGDESHILKIFGNPSYVYATVTQSILVTDSLSEPVIAFDSPQSIVMEGDGIVDIQVNMIPPSSFGARVNFSASGTLTSGVDYTFTVSNLVFDPEQGTKNIQLVLTDDPTGEGLEDLDITLDTVTFGTATIDTSGNVHQVLVQDNDFLAPFDIEGVTGGADGEVNWFLTDGNNPTIHWFDAANETAFEVTVYENDNVTVRCPKAVLPANTVSHTFGACNLVEGNTYKIKMDAIISGVPSAPGNDMMPFIVDTIAPTPFAINGILGGVDVSPDTYLSGSSYPTISWSASTGELKYRSAIYAADGVTVVCPLKDIPANGLSTSYSDTCDLTPNVNYKAYVAALDAAGNTTEAVNSPYDFLVTTIPTAYVVYGVTGGTADVVPDDSMGDGSDVIVHWEDAVGELSYDITIMENDGVTTKCPTINVPADQTSVSFPNCRFELHQQYKARVIAYDVNGNPFPAANSPFQWRSKRGLYISGTGGSYYKGIPLTTCGGVIGDVCDATTPYIASSAVNEVQIRIANNGVMVGSSWVSGASAVGNGVLDVTVDWMWIETGSRMEMSGRGFTSGNGPSPGTTGVVGAESTGGAYGAYSGRGGVSLTPASPYGDLYLADEMGSSGGASPTANPGGRGGGRVRLTVNETLYLYGEIRADGAAGTTGVDGERSGGGAGGGIWMNLNKFVGTGARIQSRGGDGSTNAGNGSGGRIAIYYEDDSGYVGGIVGLRKETYGGTTADYRAGGAGTAFFKDKINDTYGHLVVDNGPNPHNQESETLAPIGLNLDSWTTLNEGTFIVPDGQNFILPSNSLDYRLVVAGDITLPAGGDDLIIANRGWLEWRDDTNPMIYDTLDVQVGGTLTHSRNFGAKKYWLDLQVNALTVAGTIHADTRGYQANSGPGAASGEAGGAFGGESGPGASDPGNDPYGVIKNPVELGSGGGVGQGGGHLLITTNILEISGTISSNGETGQNCLGGGAGGSVNIQTTELRGNGAKIQAKGGSEGDCSTSGGGSGGRVAIYYTTDNYIGGASTISFNTTGGDGGYRDGAAGTVYYMHNGVDADGHLIVDNGVRTYSEEAATTLLVNEPFDSMKTLLSGTLKIPSGITFTLPSDTIDFRVVWEGDVDVPGVNEDLVIAKGGWVEMRRNTTVNLDSLDIQLGGTLTHTSNYTMTNAATPLHTVDINASTITVGGIIDVSSRGCDRSSCEGAGTSIGASNYGSGAGHGGYGGYGNRLTSQLGQPYGSIDTPTTMGSGGGQMVSGSNYGYGGHGGGVVRLNATTLEINGLIQSNGGNGTNDSTGTVIGAGGGGSGGSIYLTVTTLQGIGGRVIANGGIGGEYLGTWGGGGSGGRVAIYFTNDSYTGTYSNLQLQAYGGTQNNDDAGASGTVYTNFNGYDVLTINNNTNPYRQNVETPGPTGALLAGLDELQTKNAAYFIIESGDTFTVHTNPTLDVSTIDYQIVVVGTMVLPGAQNLKIVDGGVLEWRSSNTINVNNMTLQGKAKLRHSKNYTTEAYKVDLNANNLTMAGGHIDADFRGLQPGYSSFHGSASTNSGGSYGGEGGRSLPHSTTVYPSYGDLKNPNEMGQSRRSRAGGLIRITVASTATINGRISALGQTDWIEGAVGAGGASGGGIYLDTDVIAGSVGAFAADGGNGIDAGQGSYGGGGSGGRIAVLYNDDQTVTGVGNFNFSAYGGVGYTHGSGGTVFHKNKITDTYGHLIVRNSGRTYDESMATIIGDELFDSITSDSGTVIEVPAGQTFTLPDKNLNFRLILGGDLVILDGSTDLEINNRGVLEFRRTTALVFDSVKVNVGGSITHSTQTDPNTYYVNLDVGTFNLNGGVVTAIEKGPSSLSGPGTPTGFNTQGGAGYGGSGGTYTTFLGGSGYGSVKNPTDMGSMARDAGGGNNFPRRPGGRIHIDADDLILNGGIFADGGNSSGSNGASSGGTVNLVANNTLSGATGLIQARGGQSARGCGGGGRIAIRYLNDGYQDGIDNLTILAEGGVDCGTLGGGAGTIYLLDTNDDTDGRLIIANGSNVHAWGSETTILSTEAFDSVSIAQGSGVYIPAGVTFDFQRSDMDFSLRSQGTPLFAGGNLVMGSYGKILWEGLSVLNLNNLTMGNGAWMSHKDNSTSKQHILNLNITNDFIMLPGSTIDLSSKGYWADRGPGKGAPYTSNNWNSGGGGGHGGAGGTGGAGNDGDLNYPEWFELTNPGGGRNDLVSTSFSNPVELGSGGGYDGSNASENRGDGGGAILAVVGNNFSFEGAIYANGGNGFNFSGDHRGSSGGGAGGTIWIAANSLSGALGTMQARGGSPSSTSSNVAGGSGGGGQIRLDYANDYYSGGVNGINFNVSPGEAHVDRTGQPGNIYLNPSPPTNMCAGSSAPVETHNNGMLMCTNSGVEAYGSASAGAIDHCDVGYHVCTLAEYAANRASIPAFAAWLSIEDIPIGPEGFSVSVDGGTSWTVWQTDVDNKGMITDGTLANMCSDDEAQAGISSAYCIESDLLTTYGHSMCCPDPID